MKCTCGTEIREIKTDMDFFDGTVIVRGVDAYYCPKCKEELFTSTGASSLADKVKQAVPLESFSLKKGQEAELVVKSRHRLVLNTA
ncbi:YgiT-type zinc finger protein [archaeon]|nr:YgiT-type zinc finger protein [archaeon]